MKLKRIVGQLGALAQETRLSIFRLLVRRGPEGVSAGEIALSLGIRKPTLSFHLAELEHAGLVRSTRSGRSIFYAADYDAMSRLVGSLYESCCVEGGRPLPTPAASGGLRGRKPMKTRRKS